MNNYTSDPPPLPASESPQSSLPPLPAPQPKELRTYEGPHPSHPMRSYDDNLHTETKKNDRYNRVLLPIQPPSVHAPATDKPSEAEKPAPPMHGPNTLIEKAVHDADQTISDIETQKVSEETVALEKAVGQVKDDLTVISDYLKRVEDYLPQVEKLLAERKAGNKEPASSEPKKTAAEASKPDSAPPNEPVAHPETKSETKKTIAPEVKPAAAPPAAPATTRIEEKKESEPLAKNNEAANPVPSKEAKIVPIKVAVSEAKPPADTKAPVAQEKAPAPHTATPGAAPEASAPVTNPLVVPGQPAAAAVPAQPTNVVAPSPVSPANQARYDALSKEIEAMRQRLEDTKKYLQNLNAQEAKRQELITQIERETKKNLPEVEKMVAPDSEESRMEQEYRGLMLDLVPYREKLKVLQDKQTQFGNLSVFQFSEWKRLKAEIEVIQGELAPYKPKVDRAREIYDRIKDLPRFRDYFNQLLNLGDTTTLNESKPAIVNDITAQEDALKLKEQELATLTGTANPVVPTA